MIYDAENRALVLELQDCQACEHRREGVPRGFAPVFALIDCPKCKGTGRRGSGKCRACTSYSFDKRPAGKVWDYSRVDSLKPCPGCNGDFERHELETFCDTAPAAVVDALPIVVYR